MTTFTRILQSVSAIGAPVLGMPTTLAQTYGGGGVAAGVGAAGAVAGVSNMTLRTAIGNVVNTALNYTALLAVVMIVIAGFYLIFSLGDDGRKDTARKIIIYVAIGLIVILLAKVIVNFFLLLPQGGA